MRHETFKEWIYLALYGELTREQQEALDEHLKTCQVCREESRQAGNLHSLVTSRKVLPVSEDLLGEARRTLRETLRVERSKRSLMERLRSFADQALWLFRQPAFAGVSMLVIGLALGFWIFSPTTGVLFSEERAGLMEGVERGETYITSVRFVDPDPSDGEIEFTFDALTPLRIRGDMGDRRIQRILAQALMNEHNPGIRIRAVSAFSASPPKHLDPEIKSALIHVLLWDQNPGVRKEAMKALRAFPFDESVRNALLSVLLRDANDGVRIDAINFLGDLNLRPGDITNEYVQALNQRVVEEENDYIRLQTRAVLEEVKQQ